MHLLKLRLEGASVGNDPFLLTEDVHLVPGADGSDLDSATDATAVVLTQLPRREHTLRPEHHTTLANRCELPSAQHSLMGPFGRIIAVRAADMALE